MMPGLTLAGVGMETGLIWETAENFPVLEGEGDNS